MTVTTEPTEAYTDTRALLAQVATPIRAVDTERVNELCVEYNAWRDDRNGLSAAEREDDIPTPDEWQRSDAAAVKILDNLAAALGFNATS